MLPPSSVSGDHGHANVRFGHSSFLTLLYTFFILYRHDYRRVVRHPILVVAGEGWSDTPPTVPTGIVYGNDGGVGLPHGSPQTAAHFIVVYVHELNAPPGSFMT